MTTSSTDMVLRGDDPPPARIINEHGSSPFLLVGDHAGNMIPRSLGTLGLSAADLSRHIAWDIGIGALGTYLADRLDSIFIRQSYSRLVVDCNRDPSAIDAMAEESDGTPIPGNRNIRPAERARRIDNIHTPYHRAIASEMARRHAVGRRTILISLHSFTPCLANQQRPWQIGILHDGHADAFARRLIVHLNGRGGIMVGDNAPYRMNAIDYTVPWHAFARNLAYAELEVRQDLIQDETGIRRWGALIAEALQAADR